MPVLRTNPKYIAVLAVSCLLMLVVGALIRPTGRHEGNPTNVTADLLQSERIIQRQEVEQIADYFAYVAAQVEDSVVLLGATGHSGVVWQAGEVVTAARLGPFPARDKTALGSREVELKTGVSAPHLPYVLLTAPLDARVSDRRPVRLYGRGAWILAVWRSRNGGLRYSSGNLFGVTDRRCGEIDLSEVQTNLDFGSMQPGAGIFSIDGGLVAVALDCSGSLVAAEVGALESRVRAPATFEDRLVARYGMRTGQAEEAELEFFGRRAGVLVREIWWGYRAHQAGLMPGDVVLALDNAPVESMADLQRLVLPVSQEVHELRIWRARRVQTVRLLARAATEAAVSTRGFVGDSGGLPVKSVIPGSLAERAGARPGDRLLTVNQRTPASFEDLESMFLENVGWPVYLVLERRGRIWGTLVQADE
jgi:hypothetical protein